MKREFAVALVLLALAGCKGLGGEGGTPSESEEPAKTPALAEKKAEEGKLGGGFAPEFSAEFPAVVITDSLAPAATASRVLNETAPAKNTPGTGELRVPSAFLFRYDRNVDLSSIMAAPSADGTVPGSSENSYGRFKVDQAWRMKGTDTDYFYWATPENQESFNTERYSRIDETPFRLAGPSPVSTFSIDVDTASYSNVRRFVESGRLPNKDAVRIEELVNYFPYDYAPPTNGDPFSVNVNVAECPWDLEHRLVRIGIKGEEIDLSSRPASNLVFLIDVSGSMSSPDKLPLLKKSLEEMVYRLDAKDTVSIVVYAGAAGEVLPPTSGSDKETILGALDHLGAGGSTNGGAGIQLAYDRAKENFIKDGVNRVILCTDGDFNVGTTGTGDLTDMVAGRAKEGVFLSVLGFGGGNLNDAMMEEISNRGNGNYAYIDNLREGKKVLVEQMSGTLITIAKDVKIQVEFNPSQVQAYRLVGYENRVMANEDFNNDKKDAGEIGAGHTVTAFYEVIPVGVEMDVPEMDELKYQKPTGTGSNELCTVKLRYKFPDEDTSRLITQPVVDHGLKLAEADDDFIFAASVASFGMLLRGSENRGLLDYTGILELAESSEGPDSNGYRADFVAMVKKTAAITPAVSQ